MPRPKFVVFSGVRALHVDVDAPGNQFADVVDLLTARGVPLVLCSGRTRAELEYVQQRLGIAHPFVCEHGAAVFVRNGCFPESLLGGARPAGEYAVLEFGRPYADVVEAVHRAAVRARAAIVSFSEMSISEVASACGIAPLRARLAKLRDYEEAFRVLDDDGTARRRLWRQLQSAQLSCVSEGVFDFAGPPVDLGVGSQWLMALYRRAHGPTVTLGIGDQPHHTAFLRRVDVPIVVETDHSAARQLVTAVPRARLLKSRHTADLADLVAALLERHSWIAAS